MTEDDGWSESAQAWIDSLGEEGDFSRRFVLDRPMLEKAKGARRALDVGCGEGRFCRRMKAQGTQVLGVDPTERLIRRARELDPQGEYLQAAAEEMQVEEGAYDLAVSYLSLIDIPGFEAAAEKMVRALKPGGKLLVANLAPFVTAGGWLRDEDGKPIRYQIDHYLESRAEWVEWKGVRIRNWHRPLESYMRVFLGLGLRLADFAEPRPYGGDPEIVARYLRAPWHQILEWRKDP